MEADPATNIISTKHHYELFEGSSNSSNNSNNNNDAVVGGSRHLDHSSLVPMSTISEVERQVFPGIYRYQESNVNASSSASALVITGASITGDYHYPQTTLWLQIFGMTRKFFDTTSVSMADSTCRSQEQSIRNDDVKPWNEMKDVILLCRVGTREAQFELIPSNGMDDNTNEVIQIWRCPLYSAASSRKEENILSDFDFRAFHKWNVLNDDNDGGDKKMMVLPVEVIHRRIGGIDTGDIGIVTTRLVKMYLPVSEPNIGINRIRSELPAGRTFLTQRHNITLCVASHVNGIKHWNEYIRYHHDIVGIDHIHMALYTKFGKGQKEKTAQLFDVINRNFRPDITEGRLSVSALWDDDFEIRCPDQEYPKINFYQQCLYRAKSTSEFVATWDLDEYFLFSGAHDTNSRKYQTLPEFLRGIERPQCQDWCFVTVKSSLAGYEGRGYGTGLVAFDYTRRTQELTTDWQKSISRTKNAFLNSYHVPGACLPPGTRDLANTIAINPSDGGRCGFFVDEAITVHVRGMQFGLQHELEDEVTVQNELLNAVLGK